jgi:hypothetical protein
MTHPRVTDSPERGLDSPTAGAPVGAPGLALALAGPLALGALIGLPLSAATAALEAGAVSALVVGLAATMVPALYIATALVGLAPAAGEFAACALAGLRSAGIAMLGFAAPAAFLIATSGPEATAALGGVALLGGVLLGLRSLYVRLLGDADSILGALLFFGWSAIALAVGARLFFETPAVSASMGG